ncbi:MAG: TRAP transporter substrate-binding protein DctP [Alphaproteobacteria bacterium]|nr:TRAP transporter substrate-binding protein DctP [Alphaproteobacteria bacterium]
MNFKKKLMLSLTALLVSGVANAAEPQILSFSVNVPGKSSTVQDFLIPWAEKVSNASGGTIKMKVYPDGILSNIGNTIERVASGVADIGWDNPLAYGKQYEKIGVIGLPGLFQDPVKASAALWKGYDTGLFSDNLDNVKVLMLYTGPPMGMFLREKPEKPTSLESRGMLVGSKGRAMLMRGVGGRPISLSPPEYYQAIQKGVAEGALTAMIAVVSVKIDELLNYYLRGPFGGGATIIVMNKNVYAGLPPEAKAAIDASSYELGSREIAEFNMKYEESQWERLAKVEGNIVETVSVEDYPLWQSAFDAVSDEWVSNTENGAQILDTFRTILNK